jgi:hypothetical protein
MSDRLLISGAIAAMVAALLLWYLTGDARTQVAQYNQTTTPGIVRTTTITPQFTALATFPITGTVEIVLTIETTAIPAAEMTVVPTRPEDALLLTPANGAVVPEMPTEVLPEAPTEYPTEVPPVFNPTMATDVPTMIPEATYTPIDTAIPADTNTPAPTNTPLATNTPAPTNTPTPVPHPIDVLKGNVSWSGEKIITKDVLVSAGSVLTIEPGTTVRFGTGISLYVDGKLQALGRSDAPVRLTAARLPWGGVFVRPNGDALLVSTIISNGGAAATVLYAEQSNLTMRDVTMNSNIGQIRLNDAVTTIQQSVIRDNSLAYGSMIDASIDAGGSITIENSRVGPNTQVDGTSALSLLAPNPQSTVNLTLSGSIFVSSSGANLVLNSASPVNGSVQCNTFADGTIGVQIRSSLPQVPGIGLALRNNAIERHSAKYSTARGMTSDVAVDAKENWWNSASGPYDPLRYRAGRGESVGTTVVADKWLTVRPACAPIP